MLDRPLRHGFALSEVDAAANLLDFGHAAGRHAETSAIPSPTATWCTCGMAAHLPADADGHFSRFAPLRPPCRSIATRPDRRTWYKSATSRLLAIDGQRVLDQVVRADADEIDLLEETCRASSPRRALRPSCRPGFAVERHALLLPDPPSRRPAPSSPAAVPAAW